MRIAHHPADISFAVVWSNEIVFRFSNGFSIVSERFFPLPEAGAFKHLFTAIFHLILIHLFFILSISSNVLENYLWTLKKKWTGYDAFEMAWHWIMWKLWRRQNTPLQFAISLRWIRLNGIGAVLPRWNRSIAISMPFKHCRFGDGSLIFVIFLVSLLSASEQQTSYKNIT